MGPSSSSSSSSRRSHDGRQNISMQSHFQDTPLPEQPPYAKYRYLLQSTVRTIRRQQQQLNEQNDTAISRSRSRADFCSKQESRQCTSTVCYPTRRTGALVRTDDKYEHVVRTYLLVVCVRGSHAPCDAVIIYPQWFRLLTTTYLLSGEILAYCCNANGAAARLLYVLQQLCFRPRECVSYIFPLNPPAFLNGKRWLVFCRVLLYPPPYFFTASTNSAYMFR